MGVKPHYQKSGIESALILAYGFGNEKKIRNTQKLNLSWVGDFNPKMRMLHEAVGVIFSKRHLTYRKYFSEMPGSGRSTIIPIDTKEKIYRKT